MYDYVIDPTSGNDTTGDGTYANPWKLPSKAISSSSNGAIILIKGGTHILTESEFNFWTSARTWKGELDNNNNRLTTLDLNGVKVDVNYGASAITLVDIDIIDINTTALSLYSGSGGLAGVWNVSTQNMTSIWHNVRIENVALGASGSSNLVGWAGSLFALGAGFSDDTAGSTFLFTFCHFTGLGAITGTTNSAGTVASLIGATQLNTMNFTFNNCVFDTTDGGYGAGRLGALFGSREFGTLSAVQRVTLNNCIVYSPSGTQQLTRHQATSGANSFTLDANRASNNLYGTYTLDSSASYSISSVLTTLPPFVDVANRNYNLQVSDDNPLVGTGIAT